MSRYTNSIFVVYLSLSPVFLTFKRTPSKLHKSNTVLNILTFHFPTLLYFLLLLTVYFCMELCSFNPLEKKKIFPFRLIH